MRVIDEVREYLDTHVIHGRYHRRNIREYMLKTFPDDRSVTFTYNRYAGMTEITYDDFKKFMRQNKLVLLSGVQGSGKDYYADMFVSQHEEGAAYHLKFASLIREVFSSIVGKNLMDNQIYSEWKEQGDNRKKMVYFGIYLKVIFGEDVFAQYIRNKIRDIRKKNEDAMIVVSDFRFPVEYRALEELQPQVYFCNYKSDRYAIKPEEVSERMAIDFIDYNSSEMPAISNVTELFNNFLKTKEDDYLQAW